MSPSRATFGSRVPSASQGTKDRVTGWGREDRQPPRCWPAAVQAPAPTRGLEWGAGVMPHPIAMEEEAGAASWCRRTPPSPPPPEPVVSAAGGAPLQQTAVAQPHHSSFRPRSSDGKTQAETACLRPVRAKSAQPPPPAPQGGSWRDHVRRGWGPYPGVGPREGRRVCRQGLLPGLGQPPFGLQYRHPGLAGWGGCALLQNHT